MAQSLTFLNEKIDRLQMEMEQLQNRHKRLIQEKKEQERKDRTKRLCRRMGLFESMLPDSIMLTDEQFKVFLEKTIISEYSRRIMDGLTAAVAPPSAGSAASGNTTSTAKPAKAEQGSGNTTGTGEGDGTRVKS